jgi:hypothetical protein
VASGGEPIPTTEWRVCRGEIPVLGLAAGPQRSTFTDLIAVRLGPAGTPALETPDGTTVAALGRCGRGRYLACGLGLGIGPGDKDVSVTAAESAFLARAVTWLSGE